MKLVLLLKFELSLSVKCMWVIILVGVINVSGQEVATTENTNNFREKIQTTGDYLQFLPTTTALVTILIKKDKQGFWQLTKSVGTGVVSTFILKRAINKARPNGAVDGMAFPSGHTSFAFQGASFLQRRYGWKFGAPAYVVAAFVGYSRVKGLHQRHDTWDVLGGAIVGIGSTYLFTTPYQKKHFQLSLNTFDDSFVMGVNFKF